MHELLERVGERTVDEAEVDTELERPEDAVLEMRADAGKAALDIVDAKRRAHVLRACIPPEFGLQVLTDDEGIVAEVTVYDRAPVRSIGGHKTLRMTWNGLDDAVVLDGKAVPLSRLAAVLEVHDRALNWSAIQALQS